jgi:hypothetical protein
LARVSSGVVEGVGGALETGNAVEGDVAVRDDLLDAGVPVSGVEIGDVAEEADAVG